MNCNPHRGPVRSRAFNVTTGRIGDEEHKKSDIGNGFFKLSSHANDLARRIDVLKDMPDAPVRAQIYAACALIGGAELMAEVSGKDFAVRQLRLLADKLEIRGETLQ